MRYRFSSNNLRLLILIVALMIVVVSVLYTNHIARVLSEEEQKKMELWAEATQEFILADEDDDIVFVSSVIEGNTTIPAYMLDKEGNVMLTRNVKKPVKDPTTLHGPIEVKISDEVVQYIYYEDSMLLKRLRYFPYIEFGIILLFVIIAVVTLYTAQSSEQNRLWVGLSKETAHQLGTPISSMNGWQALLHSRYPDDELIPQMEDDLKRLQTIAERFSKIGSAPELETREIAEIVSDTIDYMRPRVSSKVAIQWASNDEDCRVDVCVPLFSWVLENLIKNAVDAMDGMGSINVALIREDKMVHIDISDTGRGIDKALQRTIFQPGFTSKKRGWGLGLSLSKRIIEDYHRGKLFVKSSQAGVRTTFRISLEQAK